LEPERALHRIYCVWRPGTSGGHQRDAGDGQTLLIHDLDHPSESRRSIADHLIEQISCAIARLTDRLRSVCEFQTDVVDFEFVICSDVEEKSGTAVPR